MTAMGSLAGEPVSHLKVKAPPAGAAREVSCVKLLRGWLHVAGFEASLVLGTLALAERTVACGSRR